MTSQCQIRSLQSFWSNVGGIVSVTRRGWYSESHWSLKKPSREHFVYSINSVSFWLGSLEIMVLLVAYNMQFGWDPFAVFNDPSQNKRYTFFCNHFWLAGTFDLWFFLLSQVERPLSQQIRAKFNRLKIFENYLRYLRVRDFFMHLIFQVLNFPK